MRYKIIQFQRIIWNDSLRTRCFHSHSPNLHNLSFRFGFRTCISRCPKLLHNTSRICQINYPKLCARRNFSSGNNDLRSNQHEIPSFKDLIHLSPLVFRILSACSIIHLISEYCFDITKCEGPSMMPTIQPSGEIVILERFSHRIWGLDSGDVGEERSKVSKSHQASWEKKLLQKQIKNHKNVRDKLRSEKEESCENKESNRDRTPSDLSITWHELKPKPGNDPTLLTDPLVIKLNRLRKRLCSGVQVGDVVVLQHPNRDGTVCKRVLGLPGDIVLRPNTSKYTNAGWRELYFQEEHRNVMTLFEEDEKNENISSSSLASSSLFVIPDGHLWVEGDNSINSSDSRNYGSVPASLIVGKVVMKVWPLSGPLIIERGSRPMPQKGSPFTGSTILPAGYDGQTIRRA